MHPLMQGIQVTDEDGRSHMALEKFFRYYPDDLKRLRNGERGERGDQDNGASHAHAIQMARSDAGATPREMATREMTPLGTMGWALGEVYDSNCSLRERGSLR